MLRECTDFDEGPAVCRSSARMADTPTGSGSSTTNCIGRIGPYQVRTNLPLAPGALLAPEALIGTSGSGFLINARDFPRELGA
jgi:hypothetical protein